MTSIDNVDPTKLTKEELVSLVQKHQKSLHKNKKKHKEKPFDFNRFHIRHVAFKFAYVGWNYSGLAYQTHEVKTVEEELYKAFEKTKLIQDRMNCHFSRCGRTDKGVSALGQVMALYVRSNVTKGIGIIPKDDFIENPEKKEEMELDYIKMLNGVLPEDIRILGWCPVSTRFDARFSCMFRKYKYYFIKEDMDLELMRKGAEYFVGEHDFRNFCKIQPDLVTNFNRKILSISIEKSSENEEMYEIVVVGYSFLWHQIRCMASVLFMIGKGLEAPEIILQLFDVESQKAKPQYKMASELYLCLYDCVFEDLDWKFTNHLCNLKFDLFQRFNESNL
jgi:tRNA pseudouridine38/39 synthase